MGTLRSEDVTPQVIAPGRSRYFAHTQGLMLVVFEFTDGPHAVPDPPHAHPHEQVSYIVEGEITFFLEGRPTRLKAGDLFTVPPNLPHAIQVHSPTARLVDAFTPIREDFLPK